MPPDLSWLAQLPEHLKPFAPFITPWIVRYAPGGAMALVKVFRDRYQHDPVETREKALHNASDAVQRFGTRVDDLISSGRITEVEVRARFNDPDYAKTLQQALIDASETPSEQRHEELGAIMAEMLTAPTESRRAVLLRNAAASIRNINARQARILGLAYALLHIGPEPGEEQALRDSIDAVTAYIDSRIVPTLDLFDDVAFDHVDISHLTEVGLVTILDNHFSRSESRLLRPVNFAAMSLSAEVHAHPSLVRANYLMATNQAEERVGFEHVRLTPIGFIVGLCVYQLAQGSQFVLDSSWDDPALNT